MATEPPPQPQSEPIKKLSELQIPIHLWHEQNLDFYAIKEQELETLGSKSGDVGLDFSVAVSCLTIGITSFGTLSTGTFTPTAQLGWGIVCGTSFLTAAYSGVRWLRGVKQVSKVLEDIKKRKATR